MPPNTITIAVIKNNFSYSDRYTAFAPENLSDRATGSTAEEAAMKLLLQAGRIQIIDISEPPTPLPAKPAADTQAEPIPVPPAVANEVVSAVHEMEAF